MKIVFLSNIFCHLQKPISDLLYKHTEGNYWFIETQKMPEERASLGYTSPDEPYKVFYSPENKAEIIQLVNHADVVLHGLAPYELVKERVRKGKLTFFYSERVFKKKVSLKLFLYLFREYYRQWGGRKNAYLLAASAYAAFDFRKMLCFRNKAYKWGYFSEAKKYESLEEFYKRKSSIANKRISIVWVARLIPLKHPEFAIRIAEKLKQAGYQFDLNLIGNGVMESELREFVDKNNLSDCVHVLGSMAPEKVRSYMEAGDIYLFTSDKNEGWGAVLNESMNSCCAAVASHAAGSVPFLLKDGKNGLIYRDGDLDSAYSKVTWLIEHPEERKRLGYEAYKTMTQVWSPENAAENLLSLSTSLLKGKEPTAFEGPCGVATLLRDNWYKTEY